MQQFAEPLKRTLRDGEPKVPSIVKTRALSARTKALPFRNRERIGDPTTLRNEGPLRGKPDMPMRLHYGPGLTQKRKFWGMSVRTNHANADNQIFGWNTTGADVIVRPSTKTIAAVRTSKPERAAMLAA
jgi:hypothetical protein